MPHKSPEAARAGMLRDLIFWILSKLSPYPTSKAGWRSVGIAMLEATKRSKF